jgi:hypothetical protein
MDKAQALNSFWNSFGLPAFDEQTVPDEIPDGLPADTWEHYITYETITDSIGNSVPLTASLWYRSTAWDAITQKAEEISCYIGQGGALIHYEDGALWIVRGTPFANRMADPASDTTRRILLNITAEFLSD